MGLSGGDPAVRPAPRRRFGPDLKPRVAAAVAMGGLALATAWIGGFIFAAFWWLAAVVVLWEWQRLVGGARLTERVALGGLFIALAALFALHNFILGVVAGLVIGAGAVGWLAGRGAGAWAGVGALYAGALVASVTLLRVSPSYGLAAILWIFAVVWGADVAAYFAGRAIGGPQALAERLAWQDLVRRNRRRACRRGSWPHARGVDESLDAAVLARTCDGDRVGAWRFVRIRAQATFRRQRFRVA